MRYLITGASGFVGKHIVCRLNKDPLTEQIFALARPSSDVPNGEKITRLSVEDWSPSQLLDLLSKHSFDVIIHLGAYGVNPKDRDGAQMIEINIRLLTTLVMVAGENDAALIGAGSCAEYAPSGGRIPLAESAPLEATKMYGATKAAGWLAASAIASAHGVRFHYLRLFNIFGPGENPHRLLPTILRASAGAGERAALSDGAQIRDFIMIEDVGDAFMASIRSVVSGPKAPIDMNICTGVGSSVKEFALTAVDLLGAQEAALLHFGALDRRPDDLPWLVGDPSKARAVIGWSAERNLRAGLAQAIDVSC